MDSLTAHHVARELDARWRGRPITGSTLDRASHTLTVAVAGAAIAFDLSRPHVSIHESADVPRGGVLSGWLVDGARAPDDDRRIVVDLRREGRFKGSRERRAVMQVSVLPTARGAEVRDSGGGSLLALGAPPPPSVPPRPLLEPAVVERAARDGDLATLVTGRWISPPVARWLAGNPDRATARYDALLDPAAVVPSLCDGELVPFPLCPDAVPAPSLIGPAPSPTPAGEGDRAARSDDRLARMRRRLQGELERARRAPAVRAAAQSLLALGDEPAPATVTLAAGAVVPIDPRPGETSRDAAERLFDEVRAMERALTVVPRRLEALDSRATVSPREHERAPRPRAAPPKTARGERGVGAAAFRTYRSSGGLDIWVGRGARSNDELTFHSAAPGDVWLHARDAAGAHVVLRWQRDDPPPARDLEEAAQLAAWHSKARGSTVVPVDWTRRKWVRKPRGAAPGLVLLDRSKTLFVRPDSEVERRLRAEREG